MSTRTERYADAIVNEFLDAWIRTGPHDELKSSQYLYRLTIALLDYYAGDTSEIVDRCRSAGLHWCIRPSLIEKTIARAIKESGVGEVCTCECCMGQLQDGVS